MPRFARSDLAVAALFAAALGYSEHSALPDSATTFRTVCCSLPGRLRC